MRRRFITPEYLETLLGNGILMPISRSTTKSQDLSDDYKASLLTPEAVEEMRQIMNEQFGVPSAANELSKS